ncbi:hypothetical protein J4206_02540, partial [Candidatus Woesearchaeota archaeon]|nr:hypothetical protein [Candidatus Woesearchaeota archaeon]
MRYVHELKVNVFCKEQEDEKKILEKLFALFSFEIKKQFKRETALGFFDKPIRIFQVILIKNGEINIFLKDLLGKLGKEQKELLISQIESRLDNGLNFFIRFDKDRLLKENILRITDEGNCYHLKMSIAAFPKKREVAMLILR